MFDLKQKVVVITGASSGLGKQMAKGFAEQKAHLVLMARRYEKLLELQNELKPFKIKVLPIKCDVTKTDEVDLAAKLAFEKFGRIDVLINCAGASKDGSVLNMSDEDWNFTLETDLSSVFKVTRAFAKFMKKQKYGRIINIASIYGLVANCPIDTIAYHSSKGGVVNFTREVAAELAKFNITCNAICPGFFETELTKKTLKTKEFSAFAKMRVPLGRYGKSGELNGAAIFLASDEASYITGAILPVDGGYTCV